MTTLREFALDDLFKLNSIVFDPHAEVYPLSFFMWKLLQFPALGQVAISPAGQLMGFVFGYRWRGRGNDKSELRHGHVSALAVGHVYRRLGIGTQLMESFSNSLDELRDWYVDLYVREHNQPALSLYESLGYVRYRWLPKFYSDDHGFDMRKPLARDVQLRSLQGRLLNKMLSFLNLLYYLMLLYLVGFRDWLLQDSVPNVID